MVPLRRSCLSQRMAMCPRENEFEILSTGSELVIAMVIGGHVGSKLGVLSTAKMSAPVFEEARKDVDAP